MNARAPSAMYSPCWLNSSKKLPSRGNSLPNNHSSYPLVATSVRALTTGGSARLRDNPHAPPRDDDRRTADAIRRAPSPHLATGVPARRAHAVQRPRLRRRAPARSSGSAAPTARARRRCCARLPACRRRTAGTLAWRARPSRSAAAALPRPRQRAEGRSQRQRVAALPARISTAPTSTAADARRRARALRHGQPRADASCARCRRASAAASPSRGWRCSASRCPGCSTSPSTRSTPPASRCSNARPARARPARRRRACSPATCR